MLSIDSFFNINFCYFCYFSWLKVVHFLFNIYATYLVVIHFFISLSSISRIVYRRLYYHVNDILIKIILLIHAFSLSKYYTNIHIIIFFFSMWFSDCNIIFYFCFWLFKLMKQTLFCHLLYIKIIFYGCRILLLL